MRILYENLLLRQTTTLTATSEAIACPVNNIRNVFRTVPWRSTGELATERVRADFADALPFSSMALADVSVVGSGTSIVAVASDDDDTYVQLATIPAQDARPRATYAFFAPTSHRYAGFEFRAAAGNVLAEVGYAHIGGYWEPSAPGYLDNQQDISPAPASIITESLDGQPATAKRTPFHQGTWPLRKLLDADHDLVTEIFAAVERSTPIFVVLDQARPWAVYLSILMELKRRFRGNATTPLYDFDLTWREAR